MFKHFQKVFRKFQMFFVYIFKTIIYRNRNPKYRLSLLIKMDLIQYF